MQDHKGSGKHSQEVRIHIDREMYESPNPTTGAALYALGKIGAHQELFCEEEGVHEDDMVPRDEKHIHLKQDEHFYSQKEFKIIVNAQPKVTNKRFLTFAEVVALAFNPPPSGPDVIFTITFRRGPHQNHEGTLVDGESVKVKDGMVFNVTATNKS